MTINKLEKKLIKWALGLWGVYEAIEAKFIRRTLVGILVATSFVFVLWIVVPKIMQLSYDWDQHQNINRLTADMTRYMEQVNEQEVNAKDLIRLLEKDNKALRQFVETSKNQNKTLMESIIRVQKNVNEAEIMIEERAKTNEYLSTVISGLTNDLQKAEEKQTILKQNQEKTIKELETKITQNANDKDYVTKLEIAYKVAQNEIEAKQKIINSYNVQMNSQGDTIKQLANRVVMNDMSSHKLAGPTPVNVKIQYR